MGLAPRRERSAQYAPFGPIRYDRMDTSPEKLVLDDAHKRQTEEVTNTLSQRPEGFYKSCLDQGSAVFAASCRGKTSFLGAFEHQKGGKRCL